jgi:hypothetical protein
MSPIPPPEADELAVAPYGIRYPRPGSKAFKLATRFQRIAEDVSSALAIFGLPTVVTGTPVVALSQGGRDAHWGIPTNATQRRALQDRGALTIRADLGTTERYFAGLTDGGANPGGHTLAGWYSDDTGPLDPTVPSGWKLNGASVRRKNGIVNNVGQFNSLANGTLTSSFMTIGYLPPGTFPNIPLLVSGTTSLTVLCQFQINETGVIQVRTLAGNTAYTTNTQFSISGQNWVAAV